MSAASPKVGLVAIRERREAVIETLCDAYAVDLFPEEEFERRLDVAHRADTVVALEKLVEDLDVPVRQESTALAAIPEALALDADGQRRDTKYVVSVLGGVKRSGRWRPPKKLRVFTIMGGAELDFREVALPPGVTEVRVYTLMGGTDIIVPPGVAVECEGMAVLGGFETVDRAPHARSAHEPILRITGIAIMGGVDIKTRLPGESARQAKRRRKAEGKARRLAAERRLLE